MDNIFRNDYRHPRLAELLEIFAEVGPSIIRKRIKDLKDEEKKLNDLTRYKAEVEKIYLEDIPDEEKKVRSEFLFWLMVQSPIERVKKEREHLEKNIKIFEWKMTRKDQVIDPNEITDDDVAHARETLIPSIIEIPRSNHIRCLFHDERTPSMAYFRKNNRFYCFGCQAHGDVIDIVQKIHGLKFLDAVKLLIGR